MNPFDLRGPEFLLFYLALGFTVLGVVVLRRRTMEPRGPLASRLTDPLAIAYLRGGKGGATSVACFDLSTQNVLRSQGTLLYADPKARPAKLAPLESAVLHAAAEPRTFRKIVRDPRVGEALDLLRLDLEEKGLLPTGVHKVARWLSGLTGIALLAGVAFSKMDVAAQRGRPVGFLVLLWIFFTILTLWKTSPRRTPRGERALEDLSKLMAGVRSLPTKADAEPAFASRDLLMVAAVFGIAGLPDSIRAAHAQTLPTSSSCSSWSGCGSGGGDGGGDGGGGGCGGCGGGGGD